MRRIIAILVVLLVALVVVWRLTREPEAPPRPVVADEATTRPLQSGAVRGFVDAHGSHAWLGIPFAQPPEGELRWRAPRPPRPWTGTRDALAIGNLCPQFPSLLSGADERPEDDRPVGDEDCLYLNVWAPPFEPDAVPEGEDALPVMMWIHGGGNSIGHGGSYNGAHLATRHDLVIVTINYLLGPFGWFHHPALQGDAATPEDRSGNWGTLDTIAALRWIRENIAAFGGDPEKVSIFGESAGGRDVLALMVSPPAEGLFHRAVSQSGSLRIESMARAHHFADDPVPGHPFSSREVVNALLVRDGLAADRDAAKARQLAMSDAEIRDLLLGKEAADILSVWDGGGFGMIDVPDVLGDGHVLPDAPVTELLRDPARHHDVPLILGTNRDEPRLFMARNPEWTRELLGFIPRLRDEAAYLRASHYGAASWQLSGVDELARALREGGATEVFAYRFDWDEESSLLGFDLSVALGAAHGLEIPFVFGDFQGGLGLSYIYDEERIPQRDALAERMMSYWAEFAHGGNPGRGREGRQPAWLPWGTSGMTRIVFDTERDGGVRMVEGQITAASLKAELAADQSFASAEERCRTWVRSFYRSPAWDESEFRALAGGSCAELDPARLARF